MANLPLRNLGQLGLITDANPYTYPSNAFSKAVNVVFDEDRIQRGPILKQVFPAIRSSLSYADSTGSYDSQAGTYDAAQGSPASSSRFVGSYADPTFGETVFVCDNDGQVRSYPNGSLVFASPGTGTISNEESWTHAQVAGLSFLARSGMRPYVRNVKSDITYSLMAGDWVSTHSTKVIRSYLDYVICLNVTKGTSSFPTMVKWSNPIEYSSLATSVQWDPSNTAFIAGENVLGEMTSPIRDGLVLGSNFIIYTGDQVWLMEYTGSSLVFNFRRVFPTGGIFNTNCAVEVEGKHYVFGEDDLYVHDGVSKQSIADGRIRRSVFGTLNRARRAAAFVMHDSVSNLVYYCYSTISTDVKWPSTQFCNQAAVYNYRTNTWSFMDLPNLVGGAESSINLANSVVPAISGVYTQIASTNPRVTIALGVTDSSKGLTESRVYALDLPAASLTNLPSLAETATTAVVERIGIDLDDPGMGLPLRSYKTLMGVVPQASANDPAMAFLWQFGASDLPNSPVVYKNPISFNPSVDYKIDTKVSGRYLAYRVSTSSEDSFKLVGFDAEVVSTSKR